MKEIKIRGLDESTVLKLKELSAKSGYPSLNKYLVSTLELIAKEDGLRPLEKEIRERQLKLVERFEKGNVVIIKAIEFLNRRGDDIEKNNNS